MESNNGKPLPPPPSYGTGLMDRMNIFLHVFKASRFIFRRWWVFFLSLLVTGGLAGYKAFNTPDQFRATSMLAPTPRDVSDPNAIVEPINVEREREIIFSLEVGEALNKKFADYVSPDGTKPVPKMTIMMGQNFTFKLIVTSTDPQFVKDYAVAWAEEVFATKKALADSQHQELIDLENKNVEMAQADLDKIGNKITGFLSEHPDVDVTNGKGGYTQLVERKSDLESQISSKENELKLLSKIVAEDAFQNLLSLYDENSQGAIDDTFEILNQFLKENDIESALELQNEIANAESDQKQWSVDLKPSHPYMQELVATIDGLNRQFSQKSNTFNLKIKSKKANLEQQFQAITSQIANVKHQLNIIRPQQKEYDSLLIRQYNLEEILKGQKETYFLVVKNQPRLNLAVLNSGVYQGRVAPNRPLIIGAGIIGGFIIAGVCVFFLCKLDDRLELAEEIERELHEHVIGQIPKVANSPVTKGRFLITDLGLHDMFCESLRGVRSAFKYYNKEEKKIRSFVVTSAVPGDGKSTITVNFGATLAMAGHRVLLIDADLRRGSVNEFFNFKQRAGGLSDVLSGRVHWLDVTRETTIPNLDIITTGKLPMNPGELLSSPVVGTLIQQAEKEYDYVIIDCPPLIAIDDAFSVFQHVDTGLFVVRAGQTSLRFIKNALHELDKRGQKILGIILNGITTADPSYYYAKYYHSYYNKELPSTSVETDSVHQPADYMPLPKRRQPKNDHTLMDNVDRKEHSDQIGTVTADSNPDDSQNNGSSAAAPAPTAPNPHQPQRKIVRYKAKRAYRRPQSTT